MKCLWLVLVVAACGGGVSSNPPGSWDPTLATFATAWCQWNYTCTSVHDSPSGCAMEVSTVMNTETKPELSAAAQDTCVTCMAAWTDVLDADANPCTSMLTFDQAQMTMEACGSSCIENHDLPGTSPQLQ